MSEKLNDAERAATRNEIVESLGAGVALTNLALDNLEFRANPQVLRMNSNRLNRLRQTDIAVIEGIESRFNQLTSNSEFVDSYRLSAMQNDFVFLASFFNQPLRGEIEQKVMALTESDFGALKEKWKVDIAAHQAEETARTAAREVQGQAAQTPDEVPGLGLRRIDMLAAPDLNIGATVQAVKAEIAAEGLTNNAEIMQRFRAKLVPSIVDKLEAWARSNDDFVQSLPANGVTENTTGKSEAEILEDLTGATTVGESIVGDIGGGIANGVEGLSGFGAALKYNFIEEDPLLGALFKDATGKQPLMASLFSGNFDATSFSDHIESQLAVMFPDNLDFSKIAEQFGTWADRPNNELTAEELKDIRTKLETIPRFFIGGEWEDKYHEYVRNEVAGKGAMDFPDWILTQVEGIQKLLFQIMLQFTPLINWWLNDSEDEDIDRYGEHWNEYKALEEAKGGNSDNVPPGADVPGNTDPEAIATDSPQFESLRSKYRDLVGDQTAQLNIIADGQPLSLDNVDQYGTAFASIRTLLETSPSAAHLLSRGLEISDLNFLALHNGDENTGEDGINVYFEEDGSIKMRYEFESLLTSYFGNGVDGMRDTDMAESGVGALAGAWLGFKLGMRVPTLFGKVIGVVAGSLGGAYLGAEGLSRLDNWDVFWDTTTLEADEINAQTLGSAIREIKDDVGVLEETLQGMDLEAFGNLFPALNAHRDKFNLDDIESHGGIPAALLSQNGQLSPAFVSMLEQDAEFWGGYQLTRADLVTFAENLDTSRLDFFGQVDDNDGAIEKRNPWLRREGYFVDGSGWFREKRVNNVEEFFDWLRS